MTIFGRGSIFFLGKKLMVLFLRQLLLRHTNLISSSWASNSRHRSSSLSLIWVWPQCLHLHTICMPVYSTVEVVNPWSHQKRLFILWRWTGRTMLGSPVGRKRIQSWKLFDIFAWTSAIGSPEGITLGAKAIFIPLVLCPMHTIPLCYLTRRLSTNLFWHPPTREPSVAECPYQCGAWWHIQPF